MKNTVLRLLTLIVAITALASCHKFSKNSKNNIIGNWLFSGMHLLTENTVTFSDGIDVLKTITISNAETIDNGGELQITEDTLAGKAFTYSLKTTANAYIYENNRLTDSVQSPFQFALPPVNTTVEYKRTTTDSIYFNPCLMTGFNTAESADCFTGAHINVEGNRLVITSSVEEASTKKEKGVTHSVLNKVTAQMSFKRR
ncbi:MAG: hypothetical protein QM731_15400 [Chitinophagaceae bacterium]